MRCVKCNRPLQAAFLSIRSARGMLFMGPRCAKKSGLVRQRERVKQSAGTTDDPRQMGLPL